MNGTKTRVAVMLGRLGAAVHGKIDAARAFDGGDEKSFMTGTVAGFLTIAWGLAERGLEVDAFCDAKETVRECAALGGANVYPIAEKTPDGTYDAYVSVLEPELLRKVPTSSARILVQWLNDFSYCKSDGWRDAVDLYVSPSWTHASYIAARSQIPKDKISVVPLAVNPELHVPSTVPRGRTVAYASSPDRGLHHLLEWWPEIRRCVPDAELKVYYRVLPWLNDVLNEPGLRGSKHWKRAKIIDDTFQKLGVDGQNGLRLVGPLPQRALAADLARTRVLAYPCDPVKFTEGFSMTILDACAAGCAPVVSGVDAFPELWWGATAMIPGTPSEANRKTWIWTICRALVDDDFAHEISICARVRARELSRQKVSVEWEKLIEREMRKKTSLSDPKLIALVGST